MGGAGPRSRTRRIDWRTWGLGGGAIAVGLLMALSPMASAQSYTAPYKSLKISEILTAEGTAGCGTAKASVGSKWNPTIGVFTGAGNAKSPRCKPSPTPNIGGYSMSPLGSMPIHFTSLGNHTVTVTWNFIYAATWNTHPYTSCMLNPSVYDADCNVSAQIYFQADVWLYDANYSYFQAAYNSSGFYAGVYNNSYNACEPVSSCPYYYNQTLGTSGSNSSSGSMNLTDTFNVTGIGSTSAVYTLELYGLGAGVNTQASAQYAKVTGKASASAAISLAGNGRGIYLTSIVIV